MIEATYATKDGNTRMIYADSFQELFKHLEGKDVVEIATCTINLTQMKQGKEKTSVAT
jgi:hypothetical protein